jgi:crossover junction endodeoxyribonuclease RuvC
MRVLGIDPSLQSTGFGIVEGGGERTVPIAYGIIKPTARLPFFKKLNEIRAEIEALIRTYGPDEAAIENPFFAQNVKTALLLGQVRGAVLVAIAGTGCGFHEYSALEIKKAVTGYGQAEKSQVNTMIRALLHLQEAALEPDASDALAAAYCHLNARLFQKKLEESGWEEGR